MPWHVRNLWKASVTFLRILKSSRMSFDPNSDENECSNSLKGYRVMRSVYEL